MIGYIIAFIAGAIFFALFLRINPKIAKYFYKLADKAEDVIEDKLNRNI